MNKQGLKGIKMAQKRTGYMRSHRSILFGTVGLLAMIGAFCFAAFASGDSTDLNTMGVGIGVLFCLGTVATAGTEDIKEKKTKCLKVQSELDQIKKMVDEAAAKGEDGKTEYEAFKTKYDAKLLEFDGLVKDLEDAIAASKRDKRLGVLFSEADDLTNSVVPAGVQLGGEVEGAGGGGGKKKGAEAIDHEKKEAEIENIFFKYFRKGSLTPKGERIQMSDREIIAMQPANQEVLKNVADGEYAVKIPDRIYARMMGCDLDLAKKALPMMSSDGADAGGRNYLFWAEYDNQLRFLPPEDPHFFDRVHKESVVGGELVLPILDQSENNYGGVVVSRYTEGVKPAETEANFKRRTIKCYPCGAYSRISNIMLRRDRVGVENYLTTAFGAAYRGRLSWEIQHGTGDAGSMCLGIRQDDDVQRVARHTANAVTRQDFIKMKHKINPKLRSQTSYAISDSSEEYLELQTISEDGTTDRRGLFSEVLVEGNTVRKLATRSYFVGSDMSELGSDGDVINAAWLYYWLGIEQEAVISRSTHVHFDTGETAYRVDGLAGGKMLLPEAAVVLVGPNAS